MRRSLLILAAALAFGLGFGEQPSQGQAGAGIPQTVTEALARDGRALVIVGLESRRCPRACWRRRRTSSSSATSCTPRSTTPWRAAAIGVTEARRFETIPFFSAVVDNQVAWRRWRWQPGVVSSPRTACSSRPSSTACPDHPLAAWAAGATGAGWKVAVLDTGVQASHPFFGGRVTGEACFSDANGASFLSTSLCPGGAPTQVGPGAGMDCELTSSGCGHGTHVAGIAAGANGTGSLAGHSGVAPGAEILAVQVFSRFTEASACGTSPTPCVRVFFSDLSAGSNGCCRWPGLAT